MKRKCIECGTEFTPGPLNPSSCPTCTGVRRLRLGLGGFTPESYGQYFSTEPEPITEEQKEKIKKEAEKRRREHEKYVRTKMDALSRVMNSSSPTRDDIYEVKGVIQDTPGSDIQELYYKKLGAGWVIKIWDRLKKLGYKY